MSPQIHAPRLERPPRIRSLITLEIASEILARTDAAAAGAYATRIQLRQQTQDFDAWFATIVAGDPRESLEAVAAGQADLAIVGPGDLHASAPGLPLRSIFAFDDCDLVCRSDTPNDVVAAFRAAAERYAETLS